MLVESSRPGPRVRPLSSGGMFVSSEIHQAHSGKLGDISITARVNYTTWRLAKMNSPSAVSTPRSATATPSTTTGTPIQGRLRAGQPPLTTRLARRALKDDKRWVRFAPRATPASPVQHFIHHLAPRFAALSANARCPQTSRAGEIRRAIIEAIGGLHGGAAGSSSTRHRCSLPGFLHATRGTRFRDRRVNALIDARKMGRW